MILFSPLNNKEINDKFNSYRKTLFNRMMKRNIYLVCLITATILFSSCGSSKNILTHKPDSIPKREFRGAWIQTVWQSRYSNMNSAVMRHYITDMIRKLDEAGINAVIFQVRPEADAFYKSELEPWSRFLTGQQGKAPDDPEFDPLAFRSEERRVGKECRSRWLQYQ